MHPLSFRPDRSGDRIAPDARNLSPVQALAHSRNPEDIVMDWNRVEGNWKEVKGKVKEKWGETDGR